MQQEIGFPFPITPAEAGDGKLTAFFGIKSGSGASTLACWAAISLASFHEVALVDFNPESKVRSYMGFPPDVSSASILDINGVSSPESIISAGETSSWTNLRVFPGTIRTLDSGYISAALHQKACMNLKRIFSHTVAVLGPLYSSSWAGLILADNIFVVLNPSRTDMDSYRDQMETLTRLGVAPRCQTIMNKLGYPGSLDSKGIIKYFKPDLVVAYDKNVATAGNRRHLEPKRNIEKKFLEILGEPGRQAAHFSSIPKWFRRRER